MEYMTGGRAVILGKTGRNFAAGMSGGIAFVYDEDGTFPPLCNTGMVDLKPLQEKSVLQLRGLIEKHAEYTQSTVARKILDIWEASLEKFVRVMPREFARVLRDRQHFEVEQMSHVPE